MLAFVASLSLTIYGSYVTLTLRRQCELGENENQFFCICVFRDEVASLLMVVYQNQMDYATEILKMLLSDLIRSGVGSSKPELLLLRTETVAERLLTNWLSVCLHQYLEVRKRKRFFG